MTETTSTSAVIDISEIGNTIAKLARTEYETGRDTSDARRLLELILEAVHMSL